MICITRKGELRQFKWCRPRSGAASSMWTLIWFKVVCSARGPNIIPRTSVKKCRLWLDMTSDAAAGLCLHFLYISQSHIFAWRGHISIHCFIKDAPMGYWKLQIWNIENEYLLMKRYPAIVDHQQCRSRTAILRLWHGAQSWVYTIWHAKDLGYIVYQHELHCTSQPALKRSTAIGPST